MDLKKLAEPFGPDDIEYRIGQSGKTRNGQPWAKVLAYVTNRAIMARLDDVCGPAGWQNEFRPAPNDPKGESLLCGIGIEVSPGQWVWKWDGANNTDFEAIKGGISDSMKRAAVQWGMGRSLYGVGDIWAECTEEDRRGQEGWRYAKTKDGTFWWKPQEPKPKANGRKTPPKVKGVTRGTEAAFDYAKVVRDMLRKICKCETVAQANAVIYEVTGGNYTEAAELDSSPEDARKIHEALTAYGEQHNLHGLAHSQEVAAQLGFPTAASGSS